MRGETASSACRLVPMGFFGTYLFSGDSWSEVDLAAVPELVEPWLFVGVHDSDLTTVRYAPSGPGTGVAFLGFTPRTYFEDETASEPTDIGREAEGLAAWSGAVGGAAGAATANALQVFL